MIVNAVITGLSLCNDGSGPLATQRLECDMDTDIGDIHFDSNNRFPGDFQRIVSSLFESNDNEDCDISTVFNHFTDRSLQLNISIGIQQ